MKPLFVLCRTICVLFIFQLPLAAQVYSPLPWVGLANGYETGDVYKVYTTPDYTYVGGDFESLYLGGKLSSTHAINLNDYSAVNSFPTINGKTYAIISDGAGGWYVGGDFEEVNGMEKRNLVHILSDYSVDPNFNIDLQ